MNIIMDFITHTNNWIKGEIFEGILIAIFGILLALLTFICWKYGSTPTTKSLILPLIAVCLIFIGTGVSMYTSNQKRLVEYKQQFEQNEMEFIKSEKERVEGFGYMYTVTKILTTITLLVILIAFWFTENITFQGIAIGLAIFGLTIIVIDFFSVERAKTYSKEIELMLYME